MMLWIPRLIIKILGPKKKSSGTDAFESSSSNVLRSSKFSASGGSSTSFDAEAQGNAQMALCKQQLAILSTKFRRWRIIFILVMVACTVNLLVLDILWLQHNKRNTGASATSGSSGTNGGQSGSSGNSNRPTLGGSINVDN
ncbi:hypothetical protein DFS34DRAFT_592749 [Phlyctochytrium arcticum]|nr:hypothetical protein DFS34DRAFT_592749 [Phlyctochytrium arcticum]